MNMKRFLMAVAATLAIFSCTEKENGNENGNGKPSGKENTPITLTADTTTPDMSRDTQQEEVLTLSWNATTNMGTGARIEYSVLVDVKDGSFETAYEISVGNTTEHSFTAGELNAMLMDEFGCVEDETVEMDVCVLATIKNDEVDDVISNVVTVTLTTFVPKSTSLYLIGNATTANWDLAYAIPMTPIPGEDGGYSWSGELNAGEFKFMVWNDSWEPSYGPAEEEGKLYLREHVKEDPNDPESKDTYDPKFRVEEPGIYKILVNVKNMTYSIERTGGASCFTMYLAGTAVDAPLEMTRLGYTFVKAVELKAGNLYFSENAADDGKHYWAVADGQATSDGAVSLSSGYKWNATAGFHHIMLYIKDGKEKANFVAAQPYEKLYLIGDATEAGWILENALPMTKKSAYVQEWEGPLKKGQLKFSCDCQSDWMGAWYLASEAGKAPAGEAEPIIFLDKNNTQTGQMGLREFDQKWNISEAGNYKITLDQLAETVIIAKQ